MLSPSGEGLLSTRLISPPAIASKSSVSHDEQLSPADAAVIETFVVPRYLSLFGDLALQMFLSGHSARIVHLGCRTGYLDRQLCERATSATVIGVDVSSSALDLARNKARVLAEKRISYRQGSMLATELPSGAFSHVVSLHPVLNAEERPQLLAEASRLLYPAGQLLVAMPLRGSYQEIADLFREYSLKYDDTKFGEAIEVAMQTRPTIETLSEELESVDFDDVDVEIRQTQLAFDSGRAFVEDPVSRLLIQPELRSELGIADLTRPLEYVRDAIDKYWSETKFELTLNVGCASARKIG
jgi:ubiquinone/menaquinone biosynthesis C-methylase UbiE